jgi:hypothetical protein
MRILKKILKFVGYFALTIIIVVSIVFLAATFKKPSNDRVWDTTVKVLPEISFNQNKVEIKNLRDFSYSEKDKVEKEEYYNDSFDKERIKEVYFLVNPFGDHSSFAHTFFSFVFEDGKSVSVSIEARKEFGETYSTIKGLLNNFELSILWGSEKDFFTRRAVYFDEDLLRYRLMISTTTAEALFTDLLNETIKNGSGPKFYNTITDNCTNLLADSANRINPGSIPWTSARVFTGYADKVLYDLGFIENDTRGFEYVKEKANISPLIKKMFESNPGITRYGFSNLIDTLQ